MGFSKFYAIFGIIEDNDLLVNIHPESGESYLFKPLLLFRNRCLGVDCKEVVFGILDHNGRQHYGLCCTIFHSS